MIRIYEFDRLSPEEILNRDIQAEEDVGAAVDAVLAEVRTKGDAALFAYTERFDGVKISANSIRVTEEEIKDAYEAVDTNLVSIIRKAKEKAKGGIIGVNIMVATHRHQRIGLRREKRRF